MTETMSPVSETLLGRKTIRIGAVGIDSSHLPEFVRRINQMNENGTGICRVTHFFDPGKHELPAADVQKWQDATLKMGVTQSPSHDALLSQVDGVMVLSVSGHSHAQLALPSLQLGLPTYIDKPLTCNLAEAQLLLSTARQSKARCYSASSLRFAAEIERLDRKKLGKLHAIDAFGPGSLNPAMAGLFFYGVHTIEMVDAIWGPGVARVRASQSTDRDLLELQYTDGRYANLRMERKGAYEFGATVHGSTGVEQYKVDFADVYNRLITGMTKFFEGGPDPVALRDIVENVAVMEAGNLSMSTGNGWVDVAEIV